MSGIAGGEVMYLVMGNRDCTDFDQASVAYPVCLYRDRASAEDHAARATSHAADIEPIAWHTNRELDLCSKNLLDPSWQRGLTMRPTTYEVVAVPIRTLVPTIGNDGDDHGAQ